MKMYSIGVALLVALVVAPGCGSDPEPKTKVRIGQNPWAGWAAIDVAKAKGFFDEEGLDVEVVHVTTDQEEATLLQGGRIDIGIGMIGTWIGYANVGDTEPLTIVAETDWSYGGDQIITKRTVDTTKLAGKSIAVYLDQPSVSFFLQQYLSELPTPLKLSDIKLVELEASAIADEFEKGTYEVTVNYEPDSLRQLSSTAGGARVKTSRSYPGVIPEGFAVRTSALGKSLSRDTVTKALRGWLKAVDWAYGPNGNGQTADPAHYEEFKSILRNQTFAESGTPAELTDAEIDGIIRGVHVHPRALWTKVNGPSTGAKIGRFDAADNDVPQPQTDGQPLADFFVEMTDFMNKDTSTPLIEGRITIDTSLALAAAK